MKLHEREALINKAEAMLREVLLEVLEMELTQSEYVSVVARVMSDSIQSSMKYVIREERHGSSNTPGGVAPTPLDKQIEMFVNGYGWYLGFEEKDPDFREDLDSIIQAVRLSERDAKLIPVEVTERVVVEEEDI